MRTFRAAAAGVTLALCAAASPALTTSAQAAPSLAPTAALVGPTTPDGAFRDPSTYTLALAHITDTQYLSQCANGAGVLPSRIRRCMAIFKGMNQWVVDNAASRKIAYTVHTGDIIDSYHLSTPWFAKGEMAKASEAMSVLDRAGMPYGVLPGNHDNRQGADPSIYNASFGPARFEAATKHATQDYYRGPWKAGDNTNHVDEITVGGYRFAVVYLGYDVTDEEAAWADAQIKARPHTNVIVATHAYLTPGDAPDGEPAGLSHDGAKVRERVVKPNRNVFLVLSGHEHGVGRNVLKDFGAPGHQVIELMADYQGYTAGWDGIGHAGFVRLLQLDTLHGELTVDTYSPSLRSFASRDHDTKAGRHYDGTEDEFTLPVTLVR